MSTADTSRPTTPIFSRMIPRGRKLSLRSSGSGGDRPLMKRLSIISKSATSRGEQHDKVTDANNNDDQSSSPTAEKRRPSTPLLERSQTPLSPNYLTDTDALALTTSEGSSHDYTELTVDKKRPSMKTYKRAQVIIDRLEGWEIILRETTAWLEEVIKINQQTSRLYQQRALPHVDWQDSVRMGRKNNAANTLLQSMRFYTAQMASTQEELGGKLHRDYMQRLNELRKECKARVIDLREKPELQMNELLRRAELTQKSMAQLKKLCQAADSTNGQVSQDPWLTNLHVLRNLKHEVDEENRMRIYMVSVQQQIALFEKRIIDALKPAVQCCYDLSGIMVSSRNSAGREAARLRRALEDLDPKNEWSRFMQNQKEELVTDENEPSKDYRRIRYNYKTHPAVMTLFKGSLSRRTGSVKRQYTERFFVLTQCGYLHQFSQNDKITSEESIYIPKAVIIPSIDISHLAHSGGGEDGDDKDNDDDDVTEYTFEIRRPGVLTDKSLHFRANSRHELVTWCRLLVNVATSAQKYYLDGANKYYNNNNKTNQRRWSGVRRKPTIERNQQQQALSSPSQPTNGVEQRARQASANKNGPNVNEQTAASTEQKKEEQTTERVEPDSIDVAQKQSAPEDIKQKDEGKDTTMTEQIDGKGKEPEKPSENSNSDDNNDDKPSQLRLRIQTARSYLPLLTSRGKNQEETQEPPKPKESVSNTSSVSYKSITNE